jgi:hypothetical protein
MFVDLYTTPVRPVPSFELIVVLDVILVANDVKEGENCSVS